MAPGVDATAAWRAYTSVGGPVYGRIERGAGWIAMLSGERHCELNMCVLLPGSGAAAARALVAVLDDVDLPAVVSVPSDHDPERDAVLVGAGFAGAALAEPLMACATRPAPASSPFRVAPAASAADVSAALAIAAEAHAVDAAMLERTYGRAAREVPGVTVWLAWDGPEPVSALWVVADATWLGVKSMMTPARHRRRGAARATLTAALAEAWRPRTRGALLWSTPAGRPLYEACGFAALDEAASWSRGADAATLAALGHGGCAPRSND
jgi:GNAT superfamily N-acetyltransferase